VIDRVRVVKVVERHPTLSWLPMDAPEAKDQIVNGLFSQEGKIRWTSKTASVVLKSPDGPLPLRVEFTIHPNSKARHVRLLLDGREVAAKTYSGPGDYALVTEPLRPAGPAAVVTIELDATFRAPGDARDLGVVLAGVGFR